MAEIYCYGTVIEMNPHQSQFCRCRYNGKICTCLQVPFISYSSYVCLFKFSLCLKYSKQNLRNTNEQI
jgi:hypothetical protein